MKRRILIYTAALAVLSATLLLCGCEHVHNFAEGRIITPSSCTAEGIREDACECGEVTEVAIPITDHVGGEWQNILEPTCTEDGVKELHCAECGLLIKIEPIPHSGHDLELWDAEAPTCTRMGWDTFELCTVCDHSTYKSLPMTAHTPGEAATCDTPQLCTECGTVLTAALGHALQVEKGVSANCVRGGKSDKIFCSLCNEVLQESIDLPLAAHKLDTIDGTEPTCSSAGLSEGEYCTFCDKVIVEQVELPPSEHDYADSKDLECDDCGFKRSLICEHKNTETLKKVTARCTNYGLTSGEVCTYCGVVTKEQKLVEPKNHDFKKIEGFAPTATTPGLTDGVYCATCKNIFKSQELIPPIGGNRPEGYDGSYHEDYNGGKLSYSVNPGGTTCTVVGIGDCTSPYIVIPEEIDGYTVTEIGSHAFWREAALCTVHISDSIKAVGDRAFSECPALVAVDISDLMVLGNKVFFGSLSADINYRHSTVYVKASKGNCTEPAVKEHFLCNGCGGYFADSAGSEQIYDVVGATVHDFDSGVCAECGVTRQSIRAIGVSYPERIASVPLGTGVASLGLPATVTVKTADRITHEAAVVWNTSGYDPLTPGRYTVYGRAELGRFILASGVSPNLSLAVEVTDKATELLDIVLMVDTNTLTDATLSEVEEATNELIDKLERAGIAMRAGLIESKHLSSTASGAAKIIYDGQSVWFADTSRFKVALSGLEVGQNAKDDKSTPIDALMIASEKMDIRKDVKTVYVLVSDGYCTLANSYGMLSVSQAVGILDRSSVYTAAIVPTRYPKSYESLLEREKGFSADISEVSSAIGTDLYDWILEIVKN